MDDSARASASAAAAAYMAHKEGSFTGRYGPGGGRPPLPDLRQRSVTSAAAGAAGGRGGGMGTASGGPSSSRAPGGGSVASAQGSEGGTSTASSSEEQVLLSWAALKEVFLKSREGIVAGGDSRGGGCVGRSGWEAWIVS